MGGPPRVPEGGGEGAGGARPRGGAPGPRLGWRSAGERAAAADRCRGWLQGRCEKGGRARCAVEAARAARGAWRERLLAGTWGSPPSGGRGAAEREASALERCLSAAAGLCREEAARACSLGFAVEGAEEAGGGV